MKWTQPFTARSGRLQQHPVYVLVIARDWTMLTTDEAAASTTINMDTGDVLDVSAGDYVWAYNPDRFEILRFGEWSNESNQIATMSRGEMGTDDQALDNGSTMFTPAMAFATEQPANTDWPFRLGMEFPEGGGQEFDLHGGRLRVDTVTVRVGDEGAWITKHIGRAGVNGNRAVLMGGYADMDFKHYVCLHAGTVTRTRIEAGGIWSFTLDDVSRKLDRELFGSVEDFTGSTNASMTDSVLTLPATNAVKEQLYSYAAAHITDWDPRAGGEPNVLLAGFALKIEDEVTTIASYNNTSHTCVIDRGAWGTTAASHTTGKTLDYAFYYEGNPIDFLLSVILTRDYGFDVLDLTRTDQPTHNRDMNTITVGNPTSSNDAFTKLGLNIPFSDVDTASFDAVRDEWYRDYYGRFVFTDATDMQQWLPDHILGPLGIYFTVNRAGKLGLAINRPTAASPTVIEHGDHTHTPDLEYSDEDIINVVTVKYDYDPWADSYDSEVQVIDATSQVTYDTEREVVLEVPWLTSDWRSSTLATRIANKKMRPYRDPNPVVPLSVLFNKQSVGLGDVIRVVEDDLPDFRTGSVGWDKLMWVAARKPNWQNGTMGLQAVASAYYKRVGLISSVSMPDYSAATDSDKQVYVFLSDPAVTAFSGSTTGGMSDGTEGYTII